jgi:uncharacterized repeat protein (TIGR04076 family)
VSETVADQHSKIRKVRITLYSSKGGQCPQGFKAGDSWLIESLKTPNGMCDAAYHSLFQTLRMLQFNGESPYGKDKNVCYVSCPDSGHVQVYKLERLPDE